jgi:hypothetical protein
MPESSTMAGFLIARQPWEKGSAQRAGSEQRGLQAKGVQDPDGVGDPDRGAEGDHVGGGLQAELEG